MGWYQLCWRIQYFVDGSWMVLPGAGNRVDFQAASFQEGNSFGELKKKSLESFSLVNAPLTDVWSGLVDKK